MSSDTSSTLSRNGRARMRRTGALLLLGAFELGAIALLHLLGSVGWLTIPWGAVDTWLELAAIEDVVGALLRTVALAIAYWLAASTASYALARATRIPSLVRATAWATVPAIRRVVDRAIAVTITTASLSAPMAALAADIANQPPPPSDPVVYQISDQGIPTPVNVTLVDPTAILPPGVGGAGYTPGAADNLGPGSVPATSPGAGNPHSGIAGRARDETIHLVVSGDNLWTIVAAHLRATFPDQTIDSNDIAPYWRRVIEINTAGLRSGDPNLIYPGEQIVLPPIDMGRTG